MKVKIEEDKEKYSKLREEEQSKMDNLKDKPEIMNENVYEIDKKIVNLFQKMKEEETIFLLEDEKMEQKIENAKKELNKIRMKTAQTTNELEAKQLQLNYEFEKAAAELKYSQEKLLIAKMGLESVKKDLLRKQDQNKQIEEAPDKKVSKTSVVKKVSMVEKPDKLTKKQSKLAFKQDSIKSSEIAKKSSRQNNVEAILEEVPKKKKSSKSKKKVRPKTPNV